MARARLETAARSIDSAPISTIHAFCQRVLTEQAFAGGRLLVQQSVESRAAFAAAFAEVLRQELAVDAAQAPYLEAYLARGGSASTVDSLEVLLYRAHQLRARWGTPFDPERIAAAAQAFARLTPTELDASTTGMHGSTAKAVSARLRMLHAATHRFESDGNTGRFLANLDLVVGKDDLLAFVGDRLEGRTGPVVAAVAELADAAIPLEAAVAQLFVPPVAVRLAARKRTAGLYDFDDMLTLVNDALRGPRGSELTATLRQRYRLAIVDEFQDTDQIQWEIFRTIFDDSAARPLYLVGDPKQAIYGFRGADVATYVEARADRGGGRRGSPPDAELSLHPRRHRRLQRDPRSDGGGAVLQSRRREIRPAGHLRPGRRRDADACRRGAAHHPAAGDRRRGRRPAADARGSGGARAGRRRRDRRAPGRRGAAARCGAAARQ